MTENENGAENVFVVGDRNFVFEQSEFSEENPLLAELPSVEEAIKFRNKNLRGLVEMLFMEFNNSLTHPFSFDEV